jgi:hypothetical protein
MVLMEGAEVVRQCHEYPANIQDFQQAGREIERLDKSWVFRNLTFWKCFKVSDEFVMHLNVNADKMFIISQVGTFIW